MIPEELCLRMLVACRDPTKKQGQDETRMQDEVIRRYMALGEEDKVKKLVWAVVCRKGDRRLLMRFADREIERMRTTRGRGAH